MHDQWNFEYSYLNLPNIFYSQTNPEKFPNLEVKLKNENLINELNLESNYFDKLITTENLKTSGFI